MRIQTGNIGKIEIASLAKAVTRNIVVLKRRARCLPVESVRLLSWNVYGESDSFLVAVTRNSTSCSVEGWGATRKRPDVLNLRHRSLNELVLTQ